MKVTPSPVPSAQPRNTTHVPRAIGEDPRLPALLETATKLEPSIAAEAIFRGLLNKFLKQKPREWLDWGNDALANVSDAANKQVEIANIIRQADLPKWMDETNKAYQQPPKKVDDSFVGKAAAIFDRSPKYQSPAFYEAQLNIAKRLISDALKICMEAEEHLREKAHYISMHAIVVQSVVTILTDHDETVICDNKIRTLINGQNTALMQLAAFENLEDTLNKHIASVDQLLFVVIPQWKLALSHA